MPIIRLCDLLTKGGGIKTLFENKIRNVLVQRGEGGDQQSSVTVLILRICFYFEGTTNIIQLTHIMLTKHIDL